jgi:hypothetical protein
LNRKPRAVPLVRVVIRRVISLEPLNPFGKCFPE